MSVSEDCLIDILKYCDLSIAALVSRQWSAVSCYIQSRCDNTCLFKHPKCMLVRPYDIAAMAVKYDSVFMLKWLLGNNACKLDNLTLFCMSRWDLYKNVHRFLTGKTKKRATMPQTDHEFAEVCHTGQPIIHPFEMTVSRLPLRGSARAHALRYNKNARFITFDSPKQYLLENYGHRIHISRQFHNHDFAGIKLMVQNAPGKSVYVDYLGHHLSICDAPHRCNCITICEWLLCNVDLAPACIHQYGILKYNMRVLQCD
ncbi:hypothetical protein F-S17_0300 [Faustovirus]|nr:hypothetical protein F-S17_0300 [Faustovirus]